MNKQWVWIAGIAVAGLAGWAWYHNKSASDNAPQNAVNPNAQIGAGAWAQGTSADLGNLLWQNQPVGNVTIIPQADSTGGYY